MGSVIDYFDCPNCGNEAFSDFYYKTGEEYVNCNHCGYHRSSIIITRDKPLNELTDDDWLHRECLNPYCAYRLKMIGDIGTTCGCCEAEDGFNSVKQAVEQMEGVELFSMSRLVNGEIVETILINNIKENENGTVL